MNDIVRCADGKLHCDESDKTENQKSDKLMVKIIEVKRYLNVNFTKNEMQGIATN